MTHDDFPDPTIQPPQRLWTPWRMSYIAGAEKEEGCVFCNRLNAKDDVNSLIVHRAKHNFLIMNLFPYNTGHLMIVPNQHASDPSELSAEALEEMGRLLPDVTSMLRFVQGCDGINIGMNLGSAAGAGIAEHIHQHFVPRWFGDANFMPITGGVKVLPEELPATYAKVRAEINRRLYGHQTAAPVVVNPQLRMAFVPEGSSILLEDQTPVWRTIQSTVAKALGQAKLWRWAGPNRVIDDQPVAPALAYLTDAEDAPEGWQIASIDDLDPQLRANLR